VFQVPTIAGLQHIPLPYAPLHKEHGMRSLHIGSATGVAKAGH
jgi:hypothetical protein